MKLQKKINYNLNSIETFHQLSSLDKEENEFAVVITKAKKEEFEISNLSSYENQTLRLISISFQ